MSYIDLRLVILFFIQWKGDSSPFPPSDFPATRFALEVMYSGGEWRWLVHFWLEQDATALLLLLLLLLYHEGHHRRCRKVGEPYLRADWVTRSLNGHLP